MNDISWYFPHHTPSLPQDAVFSKHIVSGAPTELPHIERSIFIKEVNTGKTWSFELGIESGINVPIDALVDFEERNRIGHQCVNNDVFSRCTVWRAECNIGTEIHEVAG